MVERIFHTEGVGEVLKGRKMQGRLGPEQVLPE